jgi:hypothetical protein
MKLILTSLFLFVSLAGFAQHEFAPIGAEWYYSQYTSYNPPQANYIKHTCVKDSSIAGKLVKVIRKAKFTPEGVVGLGNEYLYQNGDTIFYWKGGEFHELYNFSLSKGDSMLLYSEMPNYCKNKSPYGWVGIDSVYIVTINGFELKAYLASHKQGSAWDFDSFPTIERIGNLRYLLPQSTSCIMDIPGIGSLRCYSDPKIGAFFYDKLPCDTITAFPDFSPGLKEKEVKIYPNPFDGELSLDFITSMGKSFVVAIYNSEGQMIFSRILKRNETIKTESFPSGIYIISVTGSDGQHLCEVFIKK